MIHVCYAMRDESKHYSKFVGTSMLSMFENTNEPVTVHLITDNAIPPNNMEKLQDIALQYGQTFIIYNVDKLVPELIDKTKKSVPKIAAHWTVAVYYRLMVLHVLPTTVKKLIYLDADTMVHRDIKDFYSIDLQNYSLAAVPESPNGLTKEKALSRYLPVKIGKVNWQDYFNAGVFMVDLDKLRKDPNGNILDQCLNYLKEYPQSKFNDQDALNYVFANNYLELPETFNLLMTTAQKLKKTLTSAVCHFVASSLQTNSKEPFSSAWFKYFQMTPFYAPDIFKNFSDKAQSLIKNYQTSVDKKLERVNKVVKIINQRRKVYYMNPKDTSAVKNLFAVDGNEIGINSTAKDALNALVNEMKKTNSADSTDKKIYMIYVSDAEYKKVQKKLVENKFVEFDDFVNANDLFKPPTLKFVSLHLIKAM